MIDYHPQRDEVFELDCSLNGSHEIQIIVNHHSFWIELDFLECLLPHLVIFHQRIHDGSRAHEVIFHSIPQSFFHSQSVIQADVTQTFAHQDLLWLEERVIPHVIKRIQDEEV
jgi:hypothetical protein